MTDFGVDKGTTKITGDLVAKIAEQIGEKVKA